MARSQITILGVARLISVIIGHSRVGGSLDARVRGIPILGGESVSAGRESRVSHLAGIRSRLALARIGVSPLAHARVRGAARRFHARPQHSSQGGGFAWVAGVGASRGGAVGGRRHDGRRRDIIGATTSTTDARWVQTRILRIGLEIKTKYLHEYLCML